ncbi:16331_t:CDS:2 [Entrophospora sp. SA101]|nr:8390_t:CDS:2 [Entrophospora sp. SA101]CAJ0765164.1 16331_t:CDS:2 [Entrophospora sp. SA101]
MQLINNVFLSSSSSSLFKLQNELLLIIFSNLDVETLIRRHWRFNVDFIFDCVNQQNGNFIFKPITNGEDNHKNDIKFHHSTFLRKPTLWKVTFHDNFNRSGKKGGNSQAYINLLQKPCQLSIKSKNKTFQKIPTVYSIGNGSNHLKVPYKFTHSTKNDDSCDDYCIINLLSFEFSPSFFHPQKSEPICSSLILCSASKD